MSKEQLLAELLKLPPDERRGVIGEAIDSLPKIAPDPDMTAELRAELDRRYQDMLDHPEDEMSWEEACVRLDQRKKSRK